MNTPNELMGADERDIEQDLAALNIDAYSLSKRLQANNVAEFTLMLGGQTYTGTHSLFSRAFWESKTYGTPLSESLAELKNGD